MLLAASQLSTHLSTRPFISSFIHKYCNLARPPWKLLLTYTRHDAEISKTFFTLPFRGKLKKDIWNDHPSEWEHFLELLNYGGLRRQVYSKRLIKGFWRILSTWLLLLIAETVTRVHSTFRAIKSQTPEADNICSISYPTQPRILPKVFFSFWL